MSGHIGEKKKSKHPLSLGASKSIVRNRKTAQNVQTCRKIFELYADKGVKLPARNDSGYVFNKRRLRQKRDYRNDRDAQTLRHLSNVLFEKVRTSVQTEQEVQTIVINGRLVVSSNEAASMEWLAKHVQSHSTTKLADYVSFSAVNESERTTEVARKLGARMRGAPVTGKSTEALSTLQASANANIGDVFHHVKVHRWASDQSALLSDAKYKGKVIILEAPEAHAEQKIVRMLIAAISGQVEITKFPASIWGKKRPCQGCLKALQICKDAGFNVSFDPNPGLLWKGSCDSVDVVCQFLASKDVKMSGGQSVLDYLLNLKLSEDSFVTLSKYTGEEDQGAATDSESEIEDYKLEVSEGKKRAEAIATAAATLLGDLQVLKNGVETLVSPYLPPKTAPAPDLAKKIDEACRVKLEDAKKLFKALSDGLGELQALYGRKSSWEGYAATDLSRLKQTFALDKAPETAGKVADAEALYKEMADSTEEIRKRAETVENICTEAKAFGLKIEELRTAATKLVPQIV